MSEVLVFNGWQATVKGGLQASFKQPNGPSRPATEWSVSFTDGAIERRVLVRSYADERRSNKPEHEIPFVLSFIHDLMSSGWTPEDYQSNPGELVVPATQQITIGSTDRAKPWWKFW